MAPSDPIPPPGFPGPEIPPCRPGRPHPGLVPARCHRRRRRDRNCHRRTRPARARCHRRKPEPADPATHLPARGQAATHPARRPGVDPCRSPHVTGMHREQQEGQLHGGFQRRGAAWRQPEQQPGNFANNREKASRAGQLGGSRQGAASNPGNFANNRDRAREAGHLGGVHQGKGNNPANFANDPAKAREAGHIGGTHQGRQNNPANFANDRGKASEAGRLGGQHRGGTRGEAGDAEESAPSGRGLTTPAGSPAGIAVGGCSVSLQMEGTNGTAQGPAHPGIRRHRTRAVLRHGAGRPRRRGHAHRAQGRAARRPRGFHRPRPALRSRST